MEKRRINALIALVAVMSAIIAGLCFYVAVDFGSDIKKAKSAHDADVAGLDGCARLLSEEIVSGDTVSAYHHASEAAEYAYRAGENAAGEMFEEISSAILAGCVNDTVAAQIDGFIASGAVPEKLAFSPESMSDSVSIPSSVYISARECADRFFGAPVMKKGEVLQNGYILFSLSNAYAVIDGEKCVPIEAAISLEEDTGTLTDGECVTAAVKFLSDFFPPDFSRQASVTGITNDQNGKRSDISLISSGIPMIVTVRRDTGRVVRFIGGKQ